MPVVLELQDVRIDVGGRPVLEQLSVRTQGTQVVVLGAPRALFDACAGLVSPRAGVLRVAGLEPRDAVTRAAVASAPMDGPVPARWTLEDLVRENARLAGVPRGQLAAAAMGALRALGLETLRKTRCGGAETAVRRAAMVAAALATGAELILLEDFAPGLPDAAARSMARLCVSALQGRSWALFAGQLALSSPVGLHADEALVFVGGRLAFAGPPAEVAARERTFSVRTAGDPTALCDELRARAATVAAPYASRFTVTLPEGVSTRELLRLALATSAPVVELVPVSSALV